MSSTKLCSKAMMLRFDSYKDRVAKGEIKTLIYRTPFRFESMDQMLMIMDGVMDFAEEELEDMTPTGFHSQMTVLVNKREHSSMQGTVLMGGKVIYFRSALELMHILHEYLEGRFQKV